MCLQYPLTMDHLPRSHRHGSPLEDTIRAELRALVDRIGEYEAARLIGIGMPAVVRAAAGFGIRRGTAIAIGARLKELNQSGGA